MSLDNIHESALERVIKHHLKNIEKKYKNLKLKIQDDPKGIENQNKKDCLIEKIQENIAFFEKQGCEENLLIPFQDYIKKVNKIFNDTEKEIKDSETSIPLTEAIQGIGEQEDVKGSVDIFLKRIDIILPKK